MQKNNKKTFRIIIILVLLIIISQVSGCFLFMAVFESIDEKTNYVETLVHAELCIRDSDVAPVIVGEPQKISKNDYNYQVLESTLVYEADLFPRELKYNDNIYFCYIERMSNDYKLEIYLQCKYTDSEFEEEIKRIANIHNSACEKYSIYVEDLFELPVYVITYNFFGAFSYALLDGENKTITYVYLRDIEIYNNIVFDMKYAPTKTISESSFPTNLISHYSYNVYY